MSVSIFAAIKQAMSTKIFLIAVLGMAGVVIISAFNDIIYAARAEELLPAGSCAEMMIRAMSGNAVLLALPLIAALPYTTSFTDDIKSGFVKFYLIRTTKAGYIASKCTAAAIAGGTVVAFGIMIAFCAAAFIFLPNEATNTAAAETFKTAAEKIFLFFLSGAFWSCTGMTFACITNSRYMAYASPFVIYYMLVILCERYFSNIFIIYPKAWTSPEITEGLDQAGAVGIIIVLTIMMALIFALNAKKRISQI